MFNSHDIVLSKIGECKEVKSEDIKKALGYAGVSMNALARALNEKNANNLHNKLSRGGIGSKTDDELKEIAEKIGGKYYAYIEFPDGTKIGDYPDHD